MTSLKNEVIELTLPVNPAYVSAARLTASSVANRMNFDIDEVEDVKAAVSEACTFVIKKMPCDEDAHFKVSFTLGKNVLTIKLDISEHGISISESDDEMGLIMIRALIDDFEIESINKNLQIRMIKRHKEIVL